MTKLLSYYFITRLISSSILVLPGVISSSSLVGAVISYHDVLYYSSDTVGTNVNTPCHNNYSYDYPSNDESFRIISTTQNSRRPNIVSKLSSSFWIWMIPISKQCGMSQRSRTIPTAFVPTMVSCDRLQSRTTRKTTFVSSAFTTYHHRTSFIKSKPLHATSLSQQPSTTTTTTTTTTTATTLNQEEITRYSRHLVLSEVGMMGQEKLKDATVLCIGAGGLGSSCLYYLAAAGVGHIGIVDNDIVEVSNLQRQIIHTMDTIGISKCQSAQQQLRNLNPNIQIRLYEQEFTSQTAISIIANGYSKEQPKWDVVIDGSDNFPTKYLIK
jgi:ThiF family